MKFERNSLLSSVLVMIVVLFLAACGGGDDAPTDGGSEDSSPETDAERIVKVGGIFDITGATGDVGTPYAEGGEAYFEYLADQGGVEDVHIEIIGKDYAYEIPQAQTDYQEFRDRENVAAILGWGTGDTEALRQQVAQDELPFMSASYSENLKDLDESPYNFLVAASYSDQGRAILKWIEENHEGDNPTLALIYNDTAYGRSPIEDIKDAATDYGVEIVDEQIIDVAATEAQSQLMNMDKKNPDYAIIQQTWGITSVILNEAHSLGIDTQFIGLNWSAGEGLFDVVDAEAAEGFIATLSHAFPYEDFPGMAEIEEYLESKGKSLDDIDQKFVQGWATAKVIAAGIEQAAKDTDDEITGADIREGLEKLDDIDLGGLSPNVQFGPDKHWGTEETRLGIVKDGKWEQLTDYFSADD